MATMAQQLAVAAGLARDCIPAAAASSSGSRSSRSQQRRFSFLVRRAVQPLPLGRQGKVGRAWVCQPLAATGFGQPPRGGRRGEAKSAEKALQSTVELDRFIDSLLNTPPQELPQQIASNVLAFDQTFWLRLATRAETSSTPEDKRDLEELSMTVMRLVEKIVRGTEDRMNTTSDLLAQILEGVARSYQGGEIVWPPTDPQVLVELKQDVEARDREGQLDDTFLATVSAQLRQAVERGDRPGLVAMLQKVLQLVAAHRFGKSSYAAKADGSVDEAEKLLEDLLAAPEEEWDVLLRSRLALGGGSVAADDFFAALNKRSQRMFMRTESGSYEQRILGEYLKEVELRATATVEAFKSSAT